MQTGFYFDPNLSELETAAKANSKFGIAKAYQGIADQLAEASRKANPNVTCKRGCSACCSGSAILVSSVEVAMIATSTGRALNRVVDNGRNLKGVPCPFLGLEGECTIYEARPAVCRGLISFDSVERCVAETPNRDVMSLDNIKTLMIIRIKELNLAPYLQGRAGATIDIRDAFVDA